MGRHRSAIRCGDGLIHDVRVWRTSTAACGAIVLDRKQKVAWVPLLGFRVTSINKVTDEPVNCMSCLGAKRTPYAVLCDDHGQQFLTEEEYDYQMSRPNSRWACPRCGEESDFDDDEYEHGIGDDGPGPDDQ